MKILTLLMLFPLVCFAQKQKKLITIISGLLLDPLGFWIYPKIDLFFNADTCL